jgi:hypothetical protein
MIVSYNAQSSQMRFLKILCYALAWVSVFLVEQSRANPTTSSYYASVVKIYNATGSLARFENLKKSTLQNGLAYCKAGVVNSKVVGLASARV